MAAAFSWNARLGWGQAPELLQAEQVAFRQAVERAAACVVQIETFGGLERVGDELVAEGPTTGTILDPQGWIISSLYSFRQQPASILVTLPDGQRAAARIVARDYSRELVLLKVEAATQLPAATPAPADELQVGAWTVALGKTYDKQAVSQSVGIISGLGRAYGKAIQTDAKVSPINYGGPLIDIAGRVVGILSPLSPGTFLEGDSSQLYDSGIGFAIPIGDVLARLETLQSGQDIRSGKLGVVTADQNEWVGPVRISGTSPGSPAAKANLQAGDVIVQAAGRPVALLADLKQALGAIDAGQMLSLAVERQGQVVTVEAQLTDEIPVYRRRYLGLRLAPSPAGLVIEAIEDDSPAAQASLVVGEIITRCNDKPLAERADLESLVAVAELDVPLRLQVSAAPANDATADDADDTTADDAAQRTVEILATTWPEQLPQTLPKIDPRVDEKLETEVVDVILGDFPNKAFAVIPPLSESRRLGLLVVFPEPGEVDRGKVQAYWTDFCRDYGWIVAVVGSGNPRSWSREEVELAGRVMGRLGNSYRIDKSRTVIAGLGVGGRMALAAALVENQRVSGAVVAGTELPRFRWPRANAPLQSIDFLLVGDSRPLQTIAQALEEQGYAADVLEAASLDVTKWETLPAEQLHRWLEGLGRL